MTSHHGPAEPTHDDVDSFQGSPPTDNPVGDSLNIVVSVPDQINIKMVDASTLADYEVWVFMASILSNAVVGFLVAYSQAIDAKSSSTTYVGWTAIVFIALLTLAIGTALWKRSQLRKKSRDIKLKTSSASVK
jgi:hypothetical protein